MKFKCPSCASLFNGNEKHCGQKLNCPKCKIPFIAKPLTETIQFQCEQCQKAFQVDAKLSGKTATCNQCGKTIKIPLYQTQVKKTKIPKIKKNKLITANKKISQQLQTLNKNKEEITVAKKLSIRKGDERSGIKFLWLNILGAVLISIFLFALAKHNWSLTTLLNIKSTANPKNQTISTDTSIQKKESQHK